MMLKAHETPRGACRTVVFPSLVACSWTLPLSVGSTGSWPSRCATDDERCGASVLVDPSPVFVCGLATFGANTAVPPRLQDTKRRSDCGPRRHARVALLPANVPCHPTCVPPTTPTGCDSHVPHALLCPRTLPPCVHHCRDWTWRKHTQRLSHRRLFQPNAMPLSRVRRRTMPRIKVEAAAPLGRLQRPVIVLKDGTGSSHQPFSGQANTVAGGQANPASARRAFRLGVASRLKGAPQ